MEGQERLIYEWDHIAEEWIKKPAVVSVIRATDTGSLVARACKLYWIVCSPDAPGSEFELLDNTILAGTEVYCHYDSDKHSEHLILSPPQQFTKGIYVSKFDKIKCLHFGYI
ncbi:hypothetical protein ES708_02608 [subsurface metagenome]